MIITMAGGVGSGKTISAVRQAIVESEKNLVITNFGIRNLKNYYRLQQGDIIMKKENVGWLESLKKCNFPMNEEDIKRFIKNEVNAKSDKGKSANFAINWDFWEAHKNSDIFLDEAAQLIDSRSSMSIENKLYSHWIAQIRKVWGSQGDQNYLNRLKCMNNGMFHKHHQKIYSKSNNIFIITQKPRKLDVNFKELCHIHIQCSKKVVAGKTFIFQSHFIGDDNTSGIEMMELGLKPKKTFFLADSFFNRYDSYEIVRGVRL